MPQVVVVQAVEVERDFHHGRDLDTLPGIPALPFHVHAVDHGIGAPFGVLPTGGFQPLLVFRLAHEGVKALDGPTLEVQHPRLAVLQAFGQLLPYAALLPSAQGFQKPSWAQTFLREPLLHKAARFCAPAGPDLAVPSLGGLLHTGVELLADHLIGGLHGVHQPGHGVPQLDHVGDVHLVQVHFLQPTDLFLHIGIADEVAGVLVVDEALLSGLLLVHLPQRLQVLDAVGRQAPGLGVDILQHLVDLSPDLRRGFAPQPFQLLQSFQHLLPDLALPALLGLPFHPVLPALPLGGHVAGGLVFQRYLQPGLFGKGTQLAVQPVIHILVDLVDVGIGVARLVFDGVGELLLAVPAPVGLVDQVFQHIAEGGVRGEHALAVGLGHLAVHRVDLHVRGIAGQEDPCAPRLLIKVLPVVPDIRPLLLVDVDPRPVQVLPDLPEGGVRGLGDHAGLHERAEQRLLALLIHPAVPQHGLQPLLDGRAGLLPHALGGVEQVHDRASGVGHALGGLVALDLHPLPGLCLAALFLPAFQLVVHDLQRLLQIGPVASLGLRQTGGAFQPVEGVDLLLGVFHPAAQGLRGGLGSSVFLLPFGLRLRIELPEELLGQCGTLLLLAFVLVHLGVLPGLGLSVHRAGGPLGGLCRGAEGPGLAPLSVEVHAGQIVPVVFPADGHAVLPGVVLYLALAYLQQVRLGLLHALPGLQLPARPGGGLLPLRILPPHVFPGCFLRFTRFFRTGLDCRLCFPVPFPVIGPAVPVGVGFMLVYVFHRRSGGLFRRRISRAHILIRNERAVALAFVGSISRIRAVGFQLYIPRPIMVLFFKDFALSLFPVLEIQGCIFGSALVSPVIGFRGASFSLLLAWGVFRPLRGVFRRCRSRSGRRPRRPALRFPPLGLSLGVGQPFPEHVPRLFGIPRQGSRHGDLPLHVLGVHLQLGVGQLVQALGRLLLHCIEVRLFGGMAVFLCRLRVSVIGLRIIVLDLSTFVLDLSTFVLDLSTFVLDLSAFCPCLVSTHLRLRRPGGGVFILCPLPRLGFRRGVFLFQQSLQRAGLSAADPLGLIVQHLPGGSALILRQLLPGGRFPGRPGLGALRRLLCHGLQRITQPQLGVGGGVAARHRTAGAAEPAHSRAHDEAVQHVRGIDLAVELPHGQPVPHLVGPVHGLGNGAQQIGDDFFSALGDPGDQQPQGGPARVGLGQLPDQLLGDIVGGAGAVDPGHAVGDLLCQDLDPGAGQTVGQLLLQRGAVLPGLLGALPEHPDKHAGQTPAPAHGSHGGVKAHLHHVLGYVYPCLSQRAQALLGLLQVPLGVFAQRVRRLVYRQELLVYGLLVHGALPHGVPLGQISLCHLLQHIVRRGDVLPQGFLPGVALPRGGPGVYDPGGDVLSRAGEGVPDPVLPGVGPRPVSGQGVPPLQLGPQGLQLPDLCLVVLRSAEAHADHGLRLLHPPLQIPVPGDHILPAFPVFRPGQLLRLPLALRGPGIQIHHLPSLLRCGAVGRLLGRQCRAHHVHGVGPEAGTGLLLLRLAPGVRPVPPVYILLGVGDILRGLPLRRGLLSLPGLRLDLLPGPFQPLLAGLPGLFPQLPGLPGLLLDLGRRPGQPLLAGLLSAVQQLPALVRGERRVAHAEVGAPGRRVRVGGPVFCRPGRLCVQVLVLFLLNGGSGGSFRRLRRFVDIVQSPVQGFRVQRFGHFLFLLP